MKSSKKVGDPSGAIFSFSHDDLLCKLVDVIDFMETKQLIVEKSSLLFHERGYSSTSLDEVSRFTGYPTATITRHFPTVKDLSTAAFLLNVHTFNQILDGRIGTASGGGEQLSVCVEFFAEFRKYPILNGGSPMFKGVNEAKTLGFDFINHAQEANHKWNERILKMVANAMPQTKGKMVLAERCAVTIILLLEGLVIIANSGSANDSMNINTLLTNVIRSIESLEVTAPDNNLLKSVFSRMDSASYQKRIGPRDKKISDGHSTRNKFR